MTKTQATKAMRAAIRNLTPEQKANLVYHAKQRTRICCLDEWSLFADERGGG